MSTTLADVTVRLLERYDARRPDLPGEVALRDKAAESFRASGLPSVRDEAWRYTNLRVIGDIVGQASRQVVAAPDLLDRLPSIEGGRVVSVDGQLRDDLLLLREGVSLRLSDCSDLALRHRGTRPMMDLNAMLAEDAAVIQVADGVDAGTLLLASLGTGAVDAFYPRFLVSLGENARLRVLEASIGGAGSYLSNAALIATIGRGATFLHARIQSDSRSAATIANLDLHVAESAIVNSFILNVGAQLVRAETHVRIEGGGATAHLNAVQLLSARQHGDVTTVVRHEAPGCASRQTVKNVLMDHARAVFQGKIEVARAAQKTDAYQMNQSLLLSPEAEADSKPQLEIYADDVKCSHGATVGELDAEQLFYLRSRGLPLAEARKVLTEAFIAGALDEIEDSGLRAPIEDAVGAKWAEWQQ